MVNKKQCRNPKSVGQKASGSVSSVQMQRNNNGKLNGGVTGKGFLPGQSGNPGSRPKGSFKISTAFQYSLVPGDPEGRTYAQKIADTLVELAASGGRVRAKELEEVVWHKVVEIFRNPNVLQAEVARILEEMPTVELENDLDAVQEQITKKRRLRDALLIKKIYWARI